MPRSSSPAARTPAVPIRRSQSIRYAPAPATTAVHHKMEQPSVWDSVKSGFGFGIGNSIAHRMFGPTYTVEHKHSEQLKNPEYEQCMKESFNNTEACKQYLTNQKSSVPDMQ